jgi:hypothetical protein
MKAPHWRERRREYLDESGKTGAKVISIAQGYLNLPRTARVTVEEILDGVRCGQSGSAHKFLAERLEPQSRGKKGAFDGKRGTGAAGSNVAPEQLEFPAEGSAGGEGA